MRLREIRPSASQSVDLGEAPGRAVLMALRAEPGEAAFLRVAASLSRRGGEARLRQSTHPGNGP